ncbi:hypothetical protein BKA66DRAFT_446992 [Pyrenochaeta sp. MPI-SDFR-AT-0127]|nr:hypothetical protein BKA66DRAFT_446992 [Pyrenochaeta sp. MPI-SDFR-AT-0127]
MVKYLLVGWVPQTDAAAQQTKMKQGMPIGIEAPADDQIIEFDPEDLEHLPLMVVVKVVYDEKDTSTQSFVLCRQINDLCTLYMVGQKEVFYLSQFRDSTTNKKDRGGAWNRMVSKYALQELEGPKTARGLKWRRARDPSKLAGVYEEPNDVWSTKELKEILAEVDRDVTFALPENTALRNFSDLRMEGSEGFTQEEARDVLQEMRVTWPDIQGDKIDADQIYCLG